MKQHSVDKQTVAWFKLAEFVSRGEKERALAMYRLLAHALDDQAFIRQLEGDLLLAFHDELAFERYNQAAVLYVKQGQTAQAASVYEHMIMFDSITQEQLILLIDLYKQLSKETRVIEATKHMIRCLLEQKLFEQVSMILQSFDDNDAQGVLLHQELIQAWVGVENMPTDSLMIHVKKIINFYFSSKQQKSLQTFLMTLKMFHALLYQQACHYMHEQQITW